MPDMWYKVVGTVVGYLHSSDEQDSDEDHTVMVVLVEAIAGRFPEGPGLPVFVLRWCMNDWGLYRENIVDKQKAEDGELIGLRIEFTTCEREQKDYATLTEVMRTNLRTEGT